MAELKIGLIGLDTSHVGAFANCLNKPDDPEHVPGARVVAAYAGGSPDFEMSHSRVEKFTNQLRDGFSIDIKSSPEAVADAVDVVFITAVDGRTHLDYVRKTIAARKPTFIDKPFAISMADATEMFRLAEQHHVPMMSCSSLRYADSLTDALSDTSLGKIVGVDVFGPMALEAALPGLFWYGIHCVEIVNRVMGAGCREVKATTTEHSDVITATWADGRIASIRGLRGAHHHFGLTIQREKGFQFVDAARGRRSWYASMLGAILRSLPAGTSDIPPSDTLEIVRLIECANQSRQNGQSVRL
jgi:predicted dehydrogenase